jgi:hypothetical protein
MQNSIRATLLVGSPRSSNSTSNSLGTFLFDRLQKHGLKTQKTYLIQTLNSDKTRSELLKIVDESDLIVLAFPLYIDCLHSKVVEALKLIVEHEKGKEEHGKKNFAAIANNGFPESIQNNTALAVCRIFAKQAGFNWVGGLAMGGGGTIDGRPLVEIKGLARNQKKALQIAADALAKGEPIPENAVVLMSKLGFPKWLYMWMGNRNWRSQAKKNNTIDKLYDQPYKAVV